MEYFSYFSFIIFKMLFFIFWSLPEKLLDCPKKIILPDSGGLHPPAHKPMWTCLQAGKLYAWSIYIVLCETTRRARYKCRRLKAKPCQSQTAWRVAIDGLQLQIACSIATRVQSDACTLVAITSTCCARLQLVIGVQHVQVTCSYNKLYNKSTTNC